MKFIKLLPVTIVPFILGIESCSVLEKESTEPEAMRFSILSVRSTENYLPETYFSVCSTAAVSTSDKNSVYIWDDNSLHSQDEESSIYFPIDGTPIDFLLIKWPDNQVRSMSDGCVIKDQSKKDNYLKSDWLVASLTDIRPTAGLIPVSFSHERASYVFELGGILKGRKITSLKVGEYSAWCDPSGEVSGAQLILSDSDRILSGTLGILTVEGEDVGRNFYLDEAPEPVPGSSHEVVIIF